MARRKDHTREALTQLALTAAGELLEREGVEGVTVRAVAERIGYAVGTLYNLFQNLDELLLHLHGETLTRLEQALERATPDTSSPEAGVRALTVAWLDFTRQHPQRWRGLFHYRLTPGREHPDWYRARVEGVLAQVEHALGPWFPEGGEAARREAALLLLGGLHGLWSLGESGRLPLLGAPALEPLCHVMVETLLGGLKKQGS